MAVTAASRPNHYEILGVSPTAAGDEIARAFAREGSVFRPHAFGVLTELCIAYETLRDPIKRRAYDAGLALEREDVSQNRSIGARETRSEQCAPTAAPAHTGAIPLRPDRPATGQITPPEAKQTLSRGSHPEFMARLEQRNDGNDPHILLAEKLGVEARPFEWKRPAIALGTVVAAASALGGLVGYWSSRDVGDASQTAESVSVSLPAVRQLETPATPETTPAPVLSVPKARLGPAKPVVSVAAPIEPKPLDLEPTAVEEPSRQDQADPIPVEQAAGEAPASSTPASLPLSDRVIARTIERIGYSCGRVASAVPVEGEAPGVYKITCSSGQTYQAGPVNGRYHFRRWGKR